MNYLHIPKDKWALKICRLKDLQILYQSPTKDPRCLFHFLALCPDPDFWVLGNYQMGGLGDSAVCRPPKSGWGPNLEMGVELRKMTPDRNESPYQYLSFWSGVIFLNSTPISRFGPHPLLGGLQTAKSPRPPIW